MPETVAAQPPKLLTIGGSDSGGAAGIQADLKTWTALGVYGMSAITAVTAQNSVEVKAVQFLSDQFLADQIDSVLSDYGAAGVKTGFIGRSTLIQVIAQKVKAFQPKNLIIDPVLVNHKKQAMFPEVVPTAYRDYLFPLATLITPNWAEALVLCGRSPKTRTTSNIIEQVCFDLKQNNQANILITGLDRGDLILDILYSGGNIQIYERPKIHTKNLHGSGDTLSAAITAFLAFGKPLQEALNLAHSFTAGAINAAKDWQIGQGHGPLAHFWRLS